MKIKKNHVVCAVLVGLACVDANGALRPGCRKEDRRAVGGADG